MALIKCPKCGSEISDKSDKCIKCGCPLSSAAKLENEPKKKKIVKIVILFAMLITVAIAVIYFMGKNQKGGGLYNHIPWGTSYKEVKKIIEEDGIEALGDESKHKLSTMIENYGNIEGATWRKKDAVPGRQLQ